MELYSIISIVFGFAAIILAALGIVLKKDFGSVIISFGMSTAAIIVQLFDIKRLAYAEDFSAITDIMTGEVFAAIGLTTVVLILNVIAFIKKKKNI